jgi:hypothetical protein
MSTRAYYNYRNKLPQVPNHDGVGKLVIFLILIIDIFFLYYSFMYLFDKSKVPESFIYIAMIFVAITSVLALIYNFRSLTKK